MEVKIENLITPTLLVEINNAAVPDVNLLELSKAQWLLAHAALARMATVEGQAAGAIVVLPEFAAYDSDYFRWFSDRYSHFLYIDRVIVSAWARRLGVAAALYHYVEQVAEAKGVAIATEVYAKPPNVASLKFHAKMGFQEIGSQLSKLEQKTVAKLMKYSDRAGRKAGQGGETPGNPGS